MVEAEMLEQQNDDGRSRFDDQLKEAIAGECDHDQLHNGIRFRYSCSPPCAG
jgi:hypothetical protein